MHRWGTPEERQVAAAQWLLGTAVDEESARLEWASGNQALLRCGDRFAAAAIPADYVHAAAGTREEPGVRRYLSSVAEVGGPVFYSSLSTRYYALVPVNAARRRWPQGVDCHGADAVLGVPPLYCTVANDGGPGHWVLPVSGPSHLCSGAAVQMLAAVGRHHAVTTADD